MNRVATPFGIVLGSGVVLALAACTINLDGKAYTFDDKTEQPTPDAADQSEAEDAGPPEEQVDEPLSQRIRRQSPRRFAR